MDACKWTQFYVYEYCISKRIPNECEYLPNNTVIPDESQKLRTVFLKCLLQGGEDA